MRKLAFAAIGMMLVAACATTATGAQIGTAVPGKPTRTMVVKPTVTPTVAVTNTPRAIDLPTLAPIVSPSPGPAPELELVNWTLRRGYDYFYFLAEVRNNSDEVIIFPGRETGFRVKIDYVRDVEGVYYNTHVDAGISPGSDKQNMACFLLPGETGVVAVDFDHIGGKTYTHETLDSPPPGLGLQIQGYESYPRRREEFTKDRLAWAAAALDERLHPEARNLKYEIRARDSVIEGDALLLEFDVDVYEPAQQPFLDVPAWVFLYDSQGKIINILYAESLSCDGTGDDCYETGTFHFYGEGCNKEKCLFDSNPVPGGRVEWFEPRIPLTNADLQRVDHIRVFVETRLWDICRDEINWSSQ